jgi:hypothetical protein
MTFYNNGFIEVLLDTKTKLESVSGVSCEPEPDNPDSQQTLYTCSFKIEKADIPDLKDHQTVNCRAVVDDSGASGCLFSHSATPCYGKVDFSKVPKPDSTTEFKCNNIRIFG